jgi:hypothetical protein
MKNSTIHLGHAAAHCHRDSLRQAQLTKPTARPLGWPILLGSASACVGWHGVATASAPRVVSTLLAK